jgi:hypothetical protein
VADDTGLEEAVQTYLDESGIELTDDEMAVLMWQCSALHAHRRPFGNSSLFVRQVLAISVDKLRAEHAEGLYALVTRDRDNDDDEQEEHKSPSTISTKTAISRTEVIPLDLSGLDFEDLSHQPQPFNDAGSSIVIDIESDSSATADTTKSSEGQAAP